MNPESFEYLHAVVRQRSFTKAARNISISQQGLSKSIQHLEDELGFKMLKRFNKNIVLTRKGEELMPEIEEFLRAYDVLRDKALRLASENEEPAPITKILATPFFTMRILGEMVDAEDGNELEKAVICEMPIRQIIDLIKEHPHEDVAVVNILPDSRRSLFEDHSIRFDPLFSACSVVAASTKLISPRHKILTKRELSQLPMSFLNESIFNDAVDIFQKSYGIENVVLYTSNMDLMIKAVAAGRTAMLTDSFTAYLERDRDDMIFFPIDKPICSDIGFLYSTSLREESLQRRYLEELRSRIENAWPYYLRRHPVLF